MKRLVTYILGVAFILQLSAIFFIPLESSISVNITRAGKLHDGDIILRNSRGLLASLFRQTSQHEKKYSHAGIVINIDKKPYICHYIDNGEYDFIIQPVENFASYDECSEFAAYRYELTEVMKQSIRQDVIANVKRPLHFDTDFDFKSDNKLYCTEWISKCFLSVGINIPLSTSAGFDYVAPENLYLNTGCKKLFSYAYNP
jgi:hypothetical protein